MYIENDISHGVNADIRCGRVLVTIYWGREGGGVSNSGYKLFKFRYFGLLARTVHV